MSRVQRLLREVFQGPMSDYFLTIINCLYFSKSQHKAKLQPYPKNSLIKPSYQPCTNINHNSKCYTINELQRCLQMAFHQKTSWEVLNFFGVSLLLFSHMESNKHATSAHFLFFLLIVAFLESFLHPKSFLMLSRFFFLLLLCFKVRFS